MNFPEIKKFSLLTESETVATDHTTPSQLKIDGMPETEVLRIEGNVTVPKGCKEIFKSDFENLLLRRKIVWSGNITDQDSPTGMRLYRVEEVEGYKTQIDKLFWIINDDKLKAEANDKAYSDLAEQLRQEKEHYKQLAESYELLSRKFNESEWQRGQLSKVIDGLHKVIEFEQDTPWNKFTGGLKAGLKRIWKWFKGLVGK